MKILGVDYNNRVIQIKSDNDIYNIWLRKEKHKFVVDGVFKNGLEIDVVGEEIKEVEINGSGFNKRKTGSDNKEIR